jgi:glycosyltransferase involved in cell wall biosynthesis
LLRRNVRHLIFDFDDAIFLRDSYAPGGCRVHPRCLCRFRATVQASDAIIAGNSFLGDHAARWAGVQRVYVVPTCVDPQRYHPRAAPGEGNELVWIGSGSTLKGLQTVAPLWEELGRRFPELRLKVICDRFPRFQSLAVRACPWSEATEAEALAASDIGIGWMPDDTWSQGKCGLKVLQYMAAGLPVIANPVGVHWELVRHGETGYLASTPEQWQAAVARLRADPELRQRMGQAGRLVCQSRYTVGEGSRLWLDVLARLAEEQRRAG